VAAQFCDWHHANALAALADIGKTETLLIAVISYRK